MTDQYLLALKWLSPAAKTRAGEMVAEGGRAATRPGMKAPEGELDAFLFEVGRSRGQALMVVDSVARALDAAGDLAPARPEGAMETDRGRTYAERIEVLVKLAREGREANEALSAALDHMTHSVAANAVTNPDREDSDLAAYCRDRAVRRSLYMCAAHHQGAHSEIGARLAIQLGLSFPLRLEGLRAAAQREGFDIAALWPRAGNPK